MTPLQFERTRITDSATAANDQIYQLQWRALPSCKIEKITVTM